MRKDDLETAVFDALEEALPDLSAKKQRLEQLGNVQAPKPIAANELLKKARELRKRLECSDD